MKRLCIDTATQTLGVALLEDETVRSLSQSFQQKNHSLALMPSIEANMAAVQWQAEDLEEIMVSAGPGSYTGVRIGVTTAKTMAYTLHKPLVFVSTLALMATSAPYGLVIPLINARRQHVYAGIYEYDEKGVHEVYADAYMSLEEIIEHASAFDDVFFTGDAKDFATEIKAALPEAEIEERDLERMPNPARMLRCPQERLVGDDIHRATPRYLKLVEAEEKWQAEHPTCPGESYVERSN